MKYENAKDLLPEALFRELQQYAAGKLLYVPGQGTRRPWGERTGYKQQLLSRNQEIRRKFADGTAVDSLASAYCLTPETVRKIVYDRKEKNTMELTKIIQLYADEPPVSVETVTEIVRDHIDPPIYFLESAAVFPDRRFSLVVCDYSFVTPERIAQCDKVIGAYRSEGYDCPRILQNRYGELTRRASFNGRECTVFAQELPREMPLSDCEKARDEDGRLICHDELIAAAAKIAALRLEGSEVAAMEIFAPLTACGAYEDFTVEYLADLREQMAEVHPALLDRLACIEALFRENRDRLRPLYRKLPTSLFQMMESPKKETLVHADGTLAGFRDFYNGGKETCLNYLFHVIEGLCSYEYEGDNACEEMDSAELRNQRCAAFERDLQTAARYYRFSEEEIAAAPMVYKNLLIGEHYYWEIMDFAEGDGEKLSRFFDYLERQLTTEEIDFARWMRC